MSSVRIFRGLALSFMFMSVFILLPLSFMISGDRFATMSDSTSIAMAAVIAASVLALMFTGYRTPALDPSLNTEEAALHGVGRFLGLTFRRLAISEVPALFGFAMTFLNDGGGLLPAMVGVAATLVLILWHVLPNDGQIAKVQTALESNGARVQLHEVLHRRAH